VDPVPVIDAIEAWLADHLPERKDLPPHDSIVNAPDERMWASDRAGADIVFSLAADYAIALGECLRLRRQEWFWDIDREPLSNPKHKDGGRYTWRRIVLKTERQKGCGDTPIADLEGTALAAFYKLRSRSADRPTTSWWMKGAIETPLRIPPPTNPRRRTRGP
jgi:hypothetical protein